MRKVLMILAISFVIFNLSIVIVVAQLQGQPLVDSLLKELPKMKEDTNAVKLLSNISFTYNTINPDEGIKFGEKAIKLAEKINWKAGLAGCYTNLGVNYDIGKSDYPKALEYYHKALKINEGLGSKYGVAGNLGNIGILYSSQSDYSKSLEYYHKALKIFEDIGNQYGIVTILGNIGVIYFYQSDYPKALEFYHKALEIDENLGNKDGIARHLGNIGIIYSSQSDYPKALEYYYKALEIAEEIGNKLGIAKILNGIGNVSMYQSDYPKALEYYHKALTMHEELGNKFSIAINLGNIGNIHSYQSDYSKALEYFNRALKICEELGNQSSIANNLGNLGNIYLKQSDFPKALEFYHKAIKIEDLLGNKSGVAVNLGNIGELYLKQAQDSVIKNSENKLELMLNKEINLNRAIDYSQKSIDILKEIGELNGQSIILNNLASAYELKGEYKEAFETYKEHKRLQDSIFSMEKQKEIANLDAKRDNELKDKEIIILQTEKKAQQFQSYLLGGGVLVLLGAFGIAFLRFREKKKLSEKLAIQNTEIEKQKSIVEEKNDEIYASITYASTIQNAILPWESTLKNAFTDILIFYKPKDIVSGDSYWFQEVDGIKFLAVIDCTGHGIPGAMLTVIASTALDDAVLGKRLFDTGQILSYMNDKVTEVLNQRLSENSIRDGMEVALIAIHQEKVQFSGAGRPLYIKNGTMEIIKTDKRGIAGQTENDEYQFSSIEIEKSENLMLYLSSDGYADQMNENSKKYSTKRFVTLLDSISEKPIAEQQEILENEFNSHKGGRSQIDDVTILGVRI